jgi:hypothetical protein
LFATFNGALRKWFFQTTATGNIVFALLLIFPIALSIFTNRAFKKVVNNKSFFLYFLLLVIEAFNPLNLTIYHGFFGILIHSYLFILIFLYLENRELFIADRLTFIFLIIVAGEFVLAFIQYQLPGDSILNKYADVERVGGSVASIGEAVRVTGTFSYIGGYSAFISFYVFFVWYLFKINYNLVISLTLLASGVVASFMTGSRGATYIYFLVLAFFLVVEYKILKNIKFRTLLPALTLLLLAYTFNGGLGSIQKKILIAFTNFNERREGLAKQGEERQRIFGDLEDIYNFRGNYPIFGVGLGSTYQGATALYGTSNYVAEYGYYEGEAIRIILEGGFLLLIVRTALIIAILKKLFLPRLLKFLLFILLIYAIPYVFNIYNAIYLSFGIILLDNVYYHDTIKKYSISGLKLTHS